MVVLGGRDASYERGTPAGFSDENVCVCEGERVVRGGGVRNQVGQRVAPVRHGHAPALQTESFLGMHPRAG